MMPYIEKKNTCKYTYIKKNTKKKTIVIYINSSVFLFYLSTVSVPGNPCEKKNCSHLCLLKPLKDGVDAVCACPEHHELNDDLTTCTADCTRWVISP